MTQHRKHRGYSSQRIVADWFAALIATCVFGFIVFSVVVIVTAPKR